MSDASVANQGEVGQVFLVVGKENDEVFLPRAFTTLAAAKVFVADIVAELDLRTGKKNGLSTARWVSAPLGNFMTLVYDIKIEFQIYVTTVQDSGHMREWVTL